MFIKVIILQFNIIGYNIYIMLNENSILNLLQRVKEVLWDLLTLVESIPLKNASRKNLSQKNYQK